MPTNRVTFRPGVNKQFTPTLNEGGWSDASLVRFKDGLPQPIGGWRRVLQAPMLGACRKLHSWVTLASRKLLAAGTSQRLYVAEADVAHDITPLRLTVTLVNPFAVTVASQIVTVTHTAHGAVPGDIVFVSGAVAVGGLTLAGDYSILNVPTANTYLVNGGGNANTTATGGGTVGLSYYLPTGSLNALTTSGWGAGAWSSGAWGRTRAGSVLSAPIRLWSLDHWGEELVAAPRDGAIYRWRPTDGYATRAAIIAGAPIYNKFILTGMPERHLIAFGAETGGAQDPLLVRWSDVEDYTTWTATATNSAGSFRIVGGSQIMGAAATAQEILIWTDTVLWAMRFQNLPYVYGFFQQGSACGLIAPNAMTVINGVAYWMGSAGFFRYSGRVETVPCTLWDDVFRNLNAAQRLKVCCGRNFGFGEATWFYPSAGSSENDRYVTVNVNDGTWTGGALSRTAWEDADVFPSPYAAAINGQVYAHEVGTDDSDGVPLAAYIESGYFDLGDGADMMFLDQLIPDFADQSGTVNVTVSGRNYPTGAERKKGPYAVTSSTRYVTPRMRARQMKLRLENSGLGAFWRLGALRARVAPDGRKA